MAGTHGRLRGGLPWTSPGLLENRSSLLTGKKTGKLLRFSRFLRKSVSKTTGIQLLTKKFPSKQNRELIRDNREAISREQGTIREFREKSDPLAATHPMASKGFLSTNTLGFSGPAAPPRIKSAVGVTKLKIVALIFGHRVSTAPRVGRARARRCWARPAASKSEFEPHFPGVALEWLPVEYLAEPPDPYRSKVDRPLWLWL